MDLGAFIKSLEHKSILITGSTGFIGKVFLEKCLRIQPRINKIYLLIRANDNKFAAQRVQEEVIEKDLFRVLREEHGNGFDRFISEKVIPVAGDISKENLGINDSTLMNELCKGLNFILNSAATTSFDDRYDVSLGINAMGAKYVGQLAKRCDKLELLVHVSTGFVTRQKEGQIFEKPFQLGESSNGIHNLDLDMELKLVEERFLELHNKKLTDEEVRTSMKCFGTQRAIFHGWSNTYVFTKAIGEMLLGIMNNEVPLVIVRPTIVTSTYKEPFPGWIEGFRNMDPFICTYGKGKLKHFLVDRNGILDAIPVDMAVNAIIAIMAAHCHRFTNVIYHLSSSLEDPIRCLTLGNWAYEYFSKNPLEDRYGKKIKVSRFIFLPNLATFYKLLFLRYEIPITALRVVNILSFKTCGNSSVHLQRKKKLLVRLAKVYFSMTSFTGRFSETNLERLRATMKSEDAKTFDPKCIDWNDYFVNVHIPGIVKYVLK